MTNLENKVLTILKSNLTCDSEFDLLDNNVAMLNITDFDMSPEAVGGVITSLQNKGIIWVDKDTEDDHTITFITILKA